MDRTVQRAGPSVGPNDIKVVSEALESRQLVRDSHVREFERAVAAYVGRKHAVSTTSGFAALHLALLTLGIGEGDEVIVPSCTCHALFHAIRCTGAAAFVVDSDYDGMSLSMESYESGLSDRTKAVIVPHTFGFPADVESFRFPGVFVIEDCATALGGRFDGKKLGSFGDMSAFSFCATKMITSGGEGGMLLMDDQGWEIRARLTGDYKETDAPPWGPCYCYRMTEMQAAMGTNQLQDFERFRQLRSALYHRYVERLGGKLWWDNASTLPSFYTYVLKLKSSAVRDAATGLAVRGVECLPGGYTGIHRLLELDDRDFPGASQLLDTVLLLPLHPGMSLDDVDYVCDSLKEVI